MDIHEAIQEAKRQIEGAEILEAMCEKKRRIEAEDVPDLVYVLTPNQAKAAARLSWFPPFAVSKPLPKQVEDILGADDDSTIRTMASKSYEGKSVFAGLMNGVV